MPTFNGTTGDDTLVGTNFPAPDGNDTINGLAGNDTLSGLNGSDVLRAGTGIDHLIGGAGDDVLSVDPFKSDSTLDDGPGDVIEGGAGVDTMYYTTISGTTGVTVNLATGTASGGATLSGIENVVGSNHDDSLTGDAGNNLLEGGNGDDTLVGGAGNDLLRGGAGLDQLDGGAGNDTVEAGGTIDLAAGTINGVVRLTSVENVRGGGSITGNAEANILTGVANSNDTLHGAAGNDRLDGGGGSDSLYGDAGNDVLLSSGLASGVAVPILMDGGAGTDAVDYSGYLRSIYLNLQTGIGLDGDLTVTLVSIENLIGTAYNFDTLIGDGGNNVIDGLGGGDDLQGGGGDDLIRGWAAGNQLDGGAGNDTATYYNRGANGVVVDLAAGTALGVVNDILVSIENVTGSGQGNDTLSGDAGANTLAGWGGNDLLRGRAGADRLDGGVGADTASYDEGAVGVAIDLAAGTASGGNAQGDILVSIENIDGSQGNDSLTGNAGANTLDGKAGDDVLRGGAGADRLIGGNGSDTASYFDGTVGVTIDLAAGTGSGPNAQGDILQQIENVDGSQGNDSLTGNAGANTLAGWGGDDVLRGGAGADRLDGGIGIDTASYYTGSAGIVVDLSTGAASGGDAQGDTLIGIENVSGSQGVDTLIGDGGVNVLQGWNGNDVLQGGAGADRLDGGAGSDTARYDTGSIGITVDLAIGSGSGGDAQGDALVSIENVDGSQGDDQLTGNAGANVLQGLGGDDVLLGGVGADRLDGGAGSDTISYATSSTSLQVDLSTGFANFDTFVSIENVIGSQGSNELIGDAGANRLDGQGGDDVLRGGAGADQLIGGAGIDLASYFTSTAGVTVDLAAGTASGGDAQGDTLIGIENLSGSNGGNDTLSGDAGDNRLSGQWGNDVLRGGAGTDRLDGGTGTDRFIFTATADSAVGVGADRITDFSYGDRIDLAAIDADTGTDGDQAFSFIGTGLFTGVAGQLRYAMAGAVTTIAGDVDGDGVSDFHIQLTNGSVSLVAGDFVL
ncbi:beta strand repeat-containing protein [Inquilinus sp. OTU3971]|uniref:beta strand repeat-containing protein n=1 Tax=Inquilinus sp. OTU3971 TaxID=3043855 RepID=UPI00313BD12E